MSGTSASPAPEAVPALHLGSGEPLLLLHGVLLSPHCWEQTAALLAARCEVFAPALGGHWGGPEFPDGRYSSATLADRVEAQLDDLGWRTCHIAGNSLGGWVGFELARRGRARTLTAIAPAGGWKTPSVTQLRAAATIAPMIPITGALRQLGSAPVDNRIVRWVMAHLLTKNTRAVSRGDLSAVILAALHCPALPALTAGTLRGPSLANMSDLTTPVRVILADSDRVLPAAAHGRRFLRELPDSADRIMLNRAGHVPMLEDPERIANLIAEHIYASRDHLRAV
ncbi:alpha/beta fold hydrolase [Nocardia speluncae]|uniref:Alpha/beta fold hydrolase n=1 Tax=Nocardia speluncae TaxID=419477 RepID=A0A846XLB3_9NOCA|nr:alpha/beta fold hydrolase [Nocardia speluncae]NKY37068.1 alpha/beta fold hydrolase [Nocardia speluncae]